MAFATLRTRHVDGLLLPLKKFNIISNCNSNYSFLGMIIVMEMEIGIVYLV